LVFRARAPDAAGGGPGRWVRSRSGRCRPVRAGPDSLTIPAPRRSASASNEGGSMFRLIRLTWVPVALMLGACDVQVHDQTPAEYPANHDIGMYDIKATVTRDALVTPGSVFLFALGENHQRISLSQEGSEWRGLYSVRCQSSFPLQILAEWKLQGLAVAPQAGAAATPADQTGRAIAHLLGEFRLRGQAAQRRLGGERAVSLRDGAERADHRGAYRALERSCGGPQGGQGHLGTDAAAGRGRAVATWPRSVSRRAMRTRTARW